MKTKKELNSSPVKLSESWRSTNKGEVLELKRKQHSTAPRFRIGGYIRLSPTAEERDEGSLVSHPQRIKQYVDSKNIQFDGNWGEIVDWYVDKDLSGKDMNRPAFQKMLADIRSGHINAVIVTELSRLNRKVRDFLEVYELFKAHNTAFFCLRENFDTSTPIGELMLIQAMGFAQYERHTIVDRIKKGARARAERGLANGYVPLGFKLVEHRPNYREVDENEKPYVEMIFRKFLELKRLNPLLKYLNENGHRTKEFITKNGKKSGGNRWTISSLYNVLTNRSYIGEREINKRHRSSNQEKLKEDEQYCFVDAHWPAIISKELFYDVQSLLEQNKKKARRYVHEYSLTGLIHCSECGAMMVGKSGHGRNGKYFYYGHKRKLLASNDQHLHRCRVENISAQLLEEAIVSRLKDLSNDKHLIAEIAKASSSESKSKLDHQKSLIGSKEQERRKLDQKLKNLYETISETDDKELRFGLTEKAKEVRAQLGQADMALEDLKSEFSRSSNVVDVSTAFEFLKIFRNGAFEAQPVAVQAEVLRNRIKRIIVKTDGVVVEIYGRKPELVPVGDGSEEALDFQAQKLKNPPHLAMGGFEKKSGINRSTVRTVFKLVGAIGFEPTTLWSQTRCATRLRYAPTYF
jgi:site-specific DNA recombinase